MIFEENTLRGGHKPVMPQQSWAGISLVPKDRQSPPRSRVSGIPSLWGQEEPNPKVILERLDLRPRVKGLT